MKLTIDINEQDFNYAKNGTDYPMDISTRNRILSAIRNGTPVYEHERLKCEPLVEHCIGGDCKGCHNQCTWFICPICHCKVEKEDNFCKHCGADMRGKEE